MSTVFKWFANHTLLTSLLSVQSGFVTVLKVQNKFSFFYKIRRHVYGSLYNRTEQNI